jgi:hypothetical protein
LIVGAAFAASQFAGGATAKKDVAALAAQLAAERAAAAAAGAQLNETVRRSALGARVVRATGVAECASLAAEASAAAAASASEFASASVAMRNEMDAAHTQIELTQTELRAAQVARASSNLSINALSEQLRRSHAAAASINAVKQAEVDAAVARAERSEEESAAFVAALSESSVREDTIALEAAAVAAAEERRSSLSELTCPITCDVFIDPVVAADGSSYERTAIEDWLARGNTTSPMTNSPLAHTQLTPNRTLRAHVLRLAACDGAAARAERGGGGGSLSAAGDGAAAADPLLLSDTT